MNGTRARTSLGTAIDLVADRDLVVAHLVAQAGPIKHRPRDPDGHFGALVRAIVFQQLAGPAAQAIHGRVRALVAGELTPAALADVSDEAGEVGLDEVEHKLDVLRRHCDDVGRDYDTISKTMLTRTDAFSDPDAFVSCIADYAKLGIDTAIFVPTGDPVAFTRQLGTDVTARLRDL